MSREDPQLRVRIPEELKDELENRAKANRRTLTAEIIQRLEHTLTQDAIYDRTNGFEFILEEIRMLTDINDKIKEKYKRYYQAEWLHKNQKELDEAIKTLQDLLNQEPY
ncbi:Arc family DNA-binding protein [Erwinia psidii]|uniref:Arc family DNA-binding protein n=1 Tax=Erwinia psidii TaxID=69224 RepID=UPI00226B44FA|nr:Arc family DNA-binding protein [Erwinia psidii]MCX8958348.1 Arc family DNA-binding protein [Erwinia psidii]